jgi:hypothetical protein
MKAWPKTKWLWLGTAVAPLLGFVYWASPAPTNPVVVTSPDLPAWFQPPYRLRRAVPNANPAGKVYVEGMGWLPPDQVPPPGDFTPEWLDKHFTHYLQTNAFTWAVPDSTSLPDGKILGGTKVIFGERVGEFSLICTRTRDSRIMNMFVGTTNLRERSQGPPPVEEDD